MPVAGIHGGGDGGLARSSRRSTVIETIPEALTAVADSFKECANSSFGRREVTVTTDRPAAVVRRPV